MVKLADSKGKSGEGFARILGDAQIGILLSKVQAAVIRSGFELEETIWTLIPEALKTDLDSLNNIDDSGLQRPPIQVVFKPFRPDPDNVSKSIQADFLIVDNITRTFLLVEVKEGYVFDTKKADGELASLKNITSWLAQEFAYRAHYFLCSFHQDNKEIIVQGTKKRFSLDHVMTGREFCVKVGIDFDELINERKQNQTANCQYFLTELLAIPEVRAEILDLLQFTTE